MSTQEHRLRWKQVLSAYFLAYLASVLLIVFIDHPNNPLPATGIWKALVLYGTLLVISIALAKFVERDFSFRGGTIVATILTPICALFLFFAFYNAFLRPSHALPGLTAPPQNNVGR